MLAHAVAGCRCDLFVPKRRYACGKHLLHHDDNAGDSHLFVPFGLHPRRDDLLADQQPVSNRELFLSGRRHPDGLDLHGDQFAGCGCLVQLPCGLDAIWPDVHVDPDPDGHTDLHLPGWLQSGRLDVQQD